MDKISNIRKQYRKAAFLLTFSVTWSSIFFMLISINSGEFATNSFQTVYAQNNQTEADDIQRDALVRDESLQKQDLINDDNKLQPMIITKAVTNCGINPNAPPCCTPGEDKGCVDNNDDVNILQVETNPQSLKTGDEFKVQATVINNLDVPIKYTGDQCGGSPLDIQFNKNVNIKYAIACQAISTDTLGTDETTIVQGKGYEIFRAENPGKVNAQVTFLYSIEGDDGNLKQLSESFSFDIIK